MEEQTHKWELQGIGIAPFKVVCIIELPSRGLLEQNPSAYNNLMNDAQVQASRFNVGLGTCDVCSTALTINCVIEDAEGKHFVCGTECVKKSGDRGLISRSTALNNDRLRAIRQEKRRIEWESKRAIWKTRQEASRIEREVKESRRNQIEAPLRVQLEVSHKWLTDVLDIHDWNFCIEISNKLKNQFYPLSEYSNRAVTILADIYSKSYGRINSKKYNAAQEKFEDLLIISSEKVESLKKELETKLEKENKQNANS